jgi:hypothetical protein
MRQLAFLALCLPAAACATAAPPMSQTQPPLAPAPAAPPVSAYPLAEARAQIAPITMTTESAVSDSS